MSTRMRSATREGARYFQEGFYRSELGTRMKLTRACGYALHALVFMATEKKERPVASHEIAKARSIPERFLLKVLKPLVTARVLSSLKGPNGGYKLAKSPRDISLLDIVEAVDGPIHGYAPVTGEDG